MRGVVGVVPSVDSRTVASCTRFAVPMGYLHQEGMRRRHDGASALAQARFFVSPARDHARAFSPMIAPTRHERVSESGRPFCADDLDAAAQHLGEDVFAAGIAFGAPSR
jgi:hypothetical protein